MRYNKESDDFLAALYESVGAKTWEQKFNLLQLKLGGNNSFSHNPTWEQKTAMLEYELLEKERLIKLVLV